MNKLLIIVGCTFLLMTINELAISQKKEILFENKSYEPFVGVVQLYPVTNHPTQELTPPIVPIQMAQNLLLQFDLLQEEYIDVQAKLIHCNADWSQSVLNDIEFLYDYNTFDILDFEYSQNTKVLYVNYWMNMPRVKKTGNYIIQVYQNGNEKDVLFTRRFVVFENMIGITPNISMSNGVMARRLNQQIDFNLHYGRLNVSSPYTEIKVVIRQNGRWDNAITDLKPTGVFKSNSLLEYQHFNMENNFKGGNEFRLADLRTYSYRGAYVADVHPEANPRSIDMIPAKVRKYNAYSMMQDNNGGFIIGSNETFGDYLSCDYILTKFQLKSTKQQNPIYVIGAFNEWSMTPRNAMEYDELTQTYHQEVLLKQGSYDYLYWSGSEDPYLIEGSFYQTKNTYDIIVYYKSFSDLTDRVVGYSSFKTGL